MQASFRWAILGVGFALLAAVACGGSSASDGHSVAGNAGDAGSAGSGLSSSGTSNHAGSSSSSGSNAIGGASAGGTKSDGGGGQTTNLGGAGANAGGADNPTACQTVDDCVIATVFGNTGCCARTDCGSALNRDWVLEEPCASADASKDPVPDSCSKGCQLCPASHCTEPVGVQCNAGKCETISMEGPCKTDADCELAIDYTTVSGACCNCAEVVSKAFDETEACIVAEGGAKPAGCELASGACNVACVACAKPTPKCDAGRCVPG